MNTHRFVVPLLVAALAAGLFVFAPAAAVASPRCDEYDTAPVCDADQPVGGEDPIGALDATTYSWGWNTGSTQHTMVVRGWAIDLDAAGPIEVRLDVVGYTGSSSSVTATANLNRPGLDASYGRGDDHGFEIVFSITPWADAIYGDFCVTALNAGPGADTVLGCDYWVNN
jgi:hypothetical protein